MSRGRFIFWLDYSKDNELLIAETIDELKQKRTFTKTIRDGIRLICDLRAGRLDVLFELFPWVKAEFIAGVQPQETAGERYIREQLQRIEQQLREAQTMPARQLSDGISSSGQGGNAKQIGGAKPLALPTFDDDDDDETLVVATKRKSDGQSTLNFLRALDNL